jgi:hypothetical protein
MIKSEEKVKKLTEIFKKDNNIQITEEIELLRQEKPVEGIIGLLVALFDKTNDILIKKTISGFLNDLKDQSACHEVMNEIRKPWKSDTISMLVSSCWQSGLNYSEYCLDLTKIFLKGDFITAIECLTVIEGAVNGISIEKRNEIIILIKENPISSSNEKATLTYELLSILER